MKRLLLYAILLIPLRLGAVELLPDDKVDTSQEVALINRNAVRLETGKLNIRPQDVIPKQASTYYLGYSTVPWKGFFSDAATISTVTFTSATVTNLTVDALTVTSVVLSTRSEVHVSTPNGHGSSSTAIRRFASILKNTGTDITYADSAGNGASFTINTDGVYGITYQDSRSGAAFSMGITKNATSGTTSITNNLQSQFAIGHTEQGSGLYGQCSAIVFCSAGDIIRPHTDGGLNSTSWRGFFTIVRIR